MTTGHASRSCRVGSVWPGHSVWSQPPPTIHSPGAVVLALAAMRCCISCKDCAPRRSTLSWLEAALGQMHVRVVEARHHKVSAEIDDLRVASPSASGSRRSNRRPRCGRRGRRWLALERRRLGVDVAVDEDDVGQPGQPDLVRAAASDEEDAVSRQTTEQHKSAAKNFIRPQLRPAPGSAAGYASGRDRGRPGRTIREWCARRRPLPPAPIAIASRPSDSGMFASVEAR